jgi:hypothetical protein
MHRTVASVARLAMATGILILLPARPVIAQGRTDVVTLANGDRITGEVAELERGRLEFKTDDAGTLYLEWDKLTSVIASGRLVQIETADERRFLGTLTPATSRQLAVTTANGTVLLPMAEVTSITPIGRSFWRKLDGTFDVGFSYTQSSGIAQLNLNSDTLFRRPASQFRFRASFTQTETDDSTQDDRGAVEASYLRYPWKRWFLTTAGRFESNESLGIVLRSQAAGAVGPRLINSNRTELVVGGGIVVNREAGVDVEPTTNLEGLATVRMWFVTYDRPQTNLDVGVAYYPSISDSGRYRLQIDTSAKREIWSDFFVSVNFYDTFDSEPPNPDANSNDVGVVLSIGWTY